MADVAAHELVEHLTIVVDDPAHLKRVESPKFHHNRQYLIATYKLGCWLCSFQKDKSGTETGTGGLEAHHVFEWSEWNDLDPDLVTKVLAKLQFNQFSGHPVGDPDDLPNLGILHSQCHRGVPGKGEIWRHNCITTGSASFPTTMPGKFSNCAGSRRPSP